MQRSGGFLRRSSGLAWSPGAGTALSDDEGGTASVASGLRALRVTVGYSASAPFWGAPEPASCALRQGRWAARNDVQPQSPAVAADTDSVIPGLVRRARV